MQNLDQMIRRTVELLSNSQDALYANYSPQEIFEILTPLIGADVETIRNSEIELLFLPTGAIQEIAIENGWQDEYLELAAAIDAYLK